MKVKPVTIVGGGLAGLTLGIALRQRQVPVTVFEAGRYPRHRVCGEFISGRGQRVLAKLGLTAVLEKSGAGLARTAGFFFGLKAPPIRALPVPAISISRFDLDAILAQEFRDLGGDLRERTTWRENHFGEGVVRASGRRAVPVEDGWRWFGLKVHATGVSLTADLEMHCFGSGYVGVSRLPDGQVNICGLFRSRGGGGHSRGAGFELLRGAPQSALQQRLSSAAFDPLSFCSVAGLSLRPQRAGSLEECCIGDALTMIAPITGNGMSMAFEAADLACEPLAAYSRDDLDWEQARSRVAAACDRAFARRLAWGRWLQCALFKPSPGWVLLRLLLASRSMWRQSFAATR